MREERRGSKGGEVREGEVEVEGKKGVQYARWRAVLSKSLPSVRFVP